MAKSDDKKEVSMRPTVSRIKPIKPKLNVGGKFDHLNGTWNIGIHGESVLNGGYSYFFAIAGGPNRGKTALLRGLAGIAFSRTYWLRTLDDKYTTFYTSHDAESNTEEQRYTKMYQAVWYAFPEDPIEAERYIISDAQETTMEKWFEDWRNLCIYKRDVASKELKVPTPFLDRDGKQLCVIAPSFADADSISQLRSEVQTQMHEDNDVSSSKNNMYFARGGIAKTHMIDDIPPLAVASSTYTAVTVQTKTQKSFDGTPPKKIFQHMPQDVALKGVPENMLYLTLDFYLILRSDPLLASDKNGPRWPRAGELRDRANSDLNVITMVNLRGKAGPSGSPFTAVYSQSQGYLPRLTQWEDIWNEGQYGISGTLTNYALDMMPEVKLTRTTVRDLIDSNEELARALEITADLLYMGFVSSVNGENTNLLCKPSELYADIKALGYDWKELLATRGWYTFFNEKHPVPFLSTMDLLRMRAGLYHPYWMKKK